VSIRQVFLDTSDISQELLGSDTAAERWVQPSALAEWSVAGLCGHLARATTSVDHYLDQGHPEGDPVTATAYYAAAVGDEFDLHSELHTAIRQRGNDFAAEGHAALVAKQAAVIDRLRTRLKEEPPDRKIQVFRGLVLALDDYLVTRLVELTVHIDDLCVSLDVEHPSIPSEAYSLAIATLVDVARYRHGDLAVLRSLARRERDAVDAMRVL
jgi:hypothetical protein